MEVLIPELKKIKNTDWFKDLDYNQLQQEEINKLINNHTWITANRIQIPVSEMSTTHIKNCIRCFKGLGKSTIPNGYLGGKEKWLKIFNKELLKRQ